VRWRFLILYVSDDRRIGLLQMLQHLFKVGLQILYLGLLPGDDLIQLLNRVLMVHKLDFYVGYAIIHDFLLTGSGMFTPAVPNGQNSILNGSDWLDNNGSLIE
jgi:hypothetical protein